MITHAWNHLYVSVLWIIDLNAKPKIIEESRENMCDLPFGQDFLQT